MGRELADDHAAARRVFEQADAALGAPLSRLMWEGPEEELTLTRNAQPAILVHSYAVLVVLRDRLGEVALAAGHSLGEFSAHVAAGTLSFEDALRAVRLRGELMHKAGVERPGTMAAVLGLGEDAMRAACAAVTAGICVPANFNSDWQVAISGDEAGVAEGMARAKEAGAKRAVPLNVSGAFHSPLMEPAQQGLRAHLEGITFSDPAFPVVSNVTAEPVRSGAEARELLVRQLTAPVLWCASIATMLREGADRFLELGPGSVLCGLNKRNAKGAPCAFAGTPAEVEAWKP
ncbi:MAG: [acyl-carrier-protein] S-malonyltransferase [Gemmatimonadetes bacterium]|nr:[acyl-carrier-protein] S-malonyltransferase [Gemmatimonadota bacterium]